MAVYIDSSAFVKVVLTEPGHVEVRRYLTRARARHVSSALLRTEAIRAVRQAAGESLGVMRQALREVDLIAVDDSVLDAAAMLEPHGLRTLDAIHLATALTLGDDLDAIVTYDKRMSESARLLGLPVTSP